MVDLMFEPLLQPIAIPLVAGLVCLLLPKTWQPARGWLTCAATAVTVMLVWPLFAGGSRTSENGLLRVDQLSGFIMLATAVFALLIAVYSLDYMRDRQGQRLYSGCLLWSLAFAGGALLAADLVLLVVCWGLLAATLYLMIGLSGPDASDAARKTFMIVGGSDTLLLLGTALLWAQHGSTRMDAAAVTLVSATDQLAFFCFAAAAFAKAGVMPLHSWLPDCGEKAHAPVTAFLPASLDKLLGIYLLMRMVTDLFVITDQINTMFMFFGSVTILGATMLALIQRNLKRLLGYCAVGQVGYILLGIGTATALGMAAALFHMLNHAIYKSCLFLGAGVVEEKAGTVDLDRLGGLATRLPLTFASFLIASLAVAGIPPFNGFASKWMIYQAVIDSGQSSGNLFWILSLAAAMMGSAFTLALLVKVLHSVFLCKPTPHIREKNIQKAAWPTALPILLLASLCVIFGIFANGIPLRFLVLPAIGQAVEFPGTWRAGRASGLLLIALVIGWIVYAFTLRNGKLRRVPTFIGGERLDEARIPGVPKGASRHVEVTGVDFYQTVEQLPVLKPLYVLASSKVFDIYDRIGKVTAWLSTLLRAAHRGVLPTYLGWFVLGLLGILYVIMEGTP